MCYANKDEVTGSVWSLSPCPSHPYELNILLQSLRAGNITFMQFLVQAKAWVSQQLGKATDRLITQADG
jgi:hypothetical protein